jgi:8-oxo-dGTP diphosphatase
MWGAVAVGHLQCGTFLLRDVLIAGRFYCGTASVSVSVSVSVIEALTLARSCENCFMDSGQGSPARPLTDYPRPSVSVDTAVFTVESGELCVVLVDGPDGTDGTVGTGGYRRLPGTFLHQGETLADAVARSLREKAGIEGGSPRQLQVFDELDRDERGWVLSVAHAMALRSALVPFDRLVPIDRADPLAFDHARILSVAVERIRADYATMPDPWGLMPEEFTLRALLLLHSAVDPSTPQRDTFRRMMEPLLVETGEFSSGSVGKPSRIFQKPTADQQQARRFKHEDAVRSGTRRTSRSRIDEVPIDRTLTLSSRTRSQSRDEWVPLEDLPSDATYVVRLDRGEAGVVARFFADERAALWAFRAVVSTFERPENRVGPDTTLREITLVGPGRRELGSSRLS